MYDPEKPTSRIHLESMSLEEMSDIISESNNAFLAPASDPEQTTEDLLNAMWQDLGFISLRYKLDGVLISYIIALSHKDPSTISIDPMYGFSSAPGPRLGTQASAGL